RMMFSLMRTHNFYPPQYREMREQIQQAGAVTLLNEARPPIWEQVSEWMDRKGHIPNGDLCGIAGVDTLKASRMLKRWVEQGLLVADASGGKRKTRYFKPVADEEGTGVGSLSSVVDKGPA